MSVPQIFKDFCAARVRLSGWGYEEVRYEKVTLKEIFKAYNRWTIDSKAKKFPLETFKTFCEDSFGDSRGQDIYVHLRVFLDEEDVEEFEADHKKIQSNPIINPCTDALSSDQVAEHILNSENKMALVRGLIEDKWCLSSEIDELEKKIDGLERYERGTNAFILNLIKRLGEAYKKAAGHPLPSPPSVSSID